MISETISMVKNALTDPTYGVNTFLSSSNLQLLEGVYTETDTYWVCVGGEPKTFPVLIVSLADEVNFTMPEIRTSIRDVEVPIAISYWNKLVNTATGADHLYQTLSCVMNTIRQWSKNENAAARIDGQYQIVESVSVRQTTRAVSQDQDVNLLASLLIVFRVRDTNP